MEKVEKKVYNEQFYGDCKVSSVYSQCSTTLSVVPVGITIKNLTKNIELVR